MIENDREARFLDLVNRVHACEKCPRMKSSARVLGAGCGPLDAPLMFIGEAPGRLGADGSELPFHGDKSGNNFESLIEQVGISRYDVFVTNAVLCNPKDEKGNNATPMVGEIANCGPFLRETIEIVQPRIVVTLGAIALKACGSLERHGLSLREHVRTSHKWMGRVLIPLYHPGQRAMIHRSFANQLSDYQFIAECLKHLGERQRRITEREPRSDAIKLGLVAQRALSTDSRGMSYFSLHKLCFLAEVASLESRGERLTNAYVIRQKDGPYFVDLHLAKLPKLIPGMQSWSERGKVMVKASGQLGLVAEGRQPALDQEEAIIVDKVVAKYGSLSDEELKRVVYLSKYMRAILRKERSIRTNLFNAPILPYLAREKGTWSQISS